MSISNRRLLLAGASFAISGLTLGAPAFAADSTTTINAGTTRTTAVVASPAAGDTHTIDVLGSLRGAAGSGNFTAASVTGSGAGSVVVNNNGRLQGIFSMGSATGPITLHNNTGGTREVTGWATTGTSAFGSGADRIDNSASGLIEVVGSATFAFGGGNDRIDNAGMLIIDGQARTDGVLNLTGLETFNNSGLILLGSYYSVTFTPDFRSDQLANDRLNAQGVAFNGSGDSRIGMDVTFGAVTQADCATLTAADCVDFTGGSTAGSTLLTIRDGITSKTGGLNTGITLVVGSSAATDFVLDPNSVNYVQSSRGPALQKQLVIYQLAYDTTNKKHMLVGLLADEAFEGATFAASAQETWRATTGSWFERQADLRATPGGLENGGGLWMRAGFSASDRDVEASFVQSGTTYGYDVSHSQRTAHLMAGADLLGSATQGSAWVVGVMGGWTRADVDYDATPTEATYAGVVAGVYASWISGPLFVDATVTGNALDMNVDAPNMNLDTDRKLTQTVRSVGGQVEAGYRIDLGESTFVEPLANLSYVRTRMDDIAVPGGSGAFDFEDRYISFRTGAGLRAGLSAELLGMPASYSLTGRYWNESEGQNGATVLIVSGDSSTALADDFSGGFSQVAGGLNLYSDDGGVSGFANLGGKFADGYQAVDASVGVRIRW